MHGSLHFCLGLFADVWALSPAFDVAGESTCSLWGCLCGYVGLFDGYLGLFNGDIGLSDGDIGLFDGEIGLFY